MKAFHLIMLAMLAPTQAMASAAADTVAVVKNPTVVTITTSNSGRTILIEGNESDPDFRLKYECSVSHQADSDAERLWAFNSRFSKHSQQKARIRRNPKTDCGCDFYAGAAIPVNADAGLSRTGWEIGMLNVAKIEWQLSRSGTALTLGIGWHYRYFKTGDNMMALRADNGAYSLQPIPAEYNDVKSSLRNFAVQVPLLLSQRLGGKFTIEAGAAAMFNTYTTGNTTWHTGDTKSKMPLKNLHQRTLTVDIIGRIGWRDNFCFYVRYSPVELFKPQFGPQFNAVSVGGSLGF